VNVPAPFKTVFARWQREGIGLVSEPTWTTPWKRHVSCQVSWHGKPAFAKLALANRRDLDEPNMRGGFLRELWWSTIIHRLRAEDDSFPFSTPRIFESNAQDFDQEVVWFIAEYIEGKPIVDWEPERTTRKMTAAETEQFNQLLDAMVDSLLALEKIHPATVARLELPPLPLAPHGMRRWQKKGLLDLNTAVLGNGAFEIKNFWRTADGQLVIIDNEFAGWYPLYDHLSYLYHRLYCNSMRPDLARRLLYAYVDKRADRSPGACPLFVVFAEDFARLLKPRLRSGWYYDRFRRNFMMGHKKQRLRYELYWKLLLGRYGDLI
jgi:hypothetical protein